MGAIQAMKDADVKPSDYMIVGIDGLGDALGAIEKGEMGMSVYQSSKGQGEGSVRAAINLIEGKDLLEGMDYKLSDESDRVIYVPFERITAENVSDFK